MRMTDFQESYDSWCTVPSPTARMEAGCMFVLHVLKQNSCKHSEKVRCSSIYLLYIFVGLVGNYVKHFLSEKFPTYIVWIVLQTRI